MEMLGQFDLDSEAMSACKKTREEATSVVSSDSISSLPPEIKGDILSRLNVEEAVRTSTLSSTWKDAWTYMPKIITRDGNFAQTKFVTLVDTVLSLHKGTIEKFDISGKGSYHDEFVRWMLMLSRRSPRSVIIKLNSGPRYRIPSCLFSIAYLKCLCLENCTISLPRAFEGFKSLTYLSLKIFCSTDRDIQNLILCCPILTNLILIYFEGIHCLNIQAPKLEYLKVYGDFEDIALDAPNLEEATLSIDYRSNVYQSVPIALHKESLVKRALGSLSEIKSLLITGFFLKYLSKGCIPMRLPAVFRRLEYIYVMINFEDQRQVLTACSLFQIAPNLKELKISSYRWGIPDLDDQDQASTQELIMQMQMQTDHLVTASMYYFEGLDYEIDFVAKILKVEWRGDVERSKVVAKLLLDLPRASPRAKVIVTF
ncbi:hypothetical protein CFC21_038471 [Triticum aestivum]|uniref:F-box domain-containing protein n=3 Tax=Triticum aestivum TaxID=4565 RepID=A0A9R1FCQ3_WHEAT|nr:putative F-box/FBD/LRR-repeat protein At5g44950 isoform X1 [Triticum aestivum]KAF7026358.1 hypothetical protein CFC21_038471 [Triticum aestivum]